MCKSNSHPAHSAPTTNFEQALPSDAPSANLAACTPRDTVRHSHHVIKVGGKAMERLLVVIVVFLGKKVVLVFNFRSSRKSLGSFHNMRPTCPTDGPGGNPFQHLWWSCLTSPFRRPLPSVEAVFHLFTLVLNRPMTSSVVEPLVQPANGFATHRT